ncbi:MAG TPA: bifunctional DNA-formamidopyrimidine glycosylase/DNA-(apurinic or apyrimidinic site) lyase, partial [Gemmataceae bacterium]|nr:bifunctional DNA-formamidopyrimidine glycosylase/DNA-(apurinic or apyrimidinic site) lyase [Gemmataceae bacterium]
SLRRGWSADWNQALAGRTVTGVRRRGKWILLDLDRGLLVIHLGMTGRLTVGPADRPIEGHTHFLADLDDGGQMRFRDVRRFGSITLYADAGELESFLAGRLGPEPFDLGRAEFRRALATTARPLKAVLLDQRVVAGVGNIYADESLFQARLSPRILGRRTTPAQAERLRKAIVKVLDRAIEMRGSTIRDYVGGSGRRGSYQDEFRVYGRTGRPCPRCRTPIVRVRLAGRSTHYCPKCQRTGRANSSLAVNRRLAAR